MIPADTSITSTMRADFARWMAATSARLDAQDEFENYRCWFLKNSGKSSVRIYHRRGDWLYFFRYDHGDEYETLWREPYPDGPASCVIDPVKSFGNISHRLAAVSISDCGRWVAFSLNERGNDDETVGVVDTNAEESVFKIADRQKYVRLTWTHDGKQLWFSRWWGDLGGYSIDYFDPFRPDMVSERIMDFRSQPDLIPYPGRCFGTEPIFVGACKGADFRNALWVKLSMDREFEIVQDIGSFSTSPVAVIGDCLLLETTRDANCGRVVSLHKDELTGAWRDVVAEKDLPLVHALMYKSVLYTVHSNAIEEIITATDVQTGLAKIVPSFPGGVTTPIPSQDHSNDFSALIEAVCRPPEVAVFDSSDWCWSPRGISDCDYVREILWTVSFDGVRVPITLTYLEGDRSRGSIILYTYGGFGTIAFASYDPFAHSWIRDGGIWAVAHVRGGGELGEDWHFSATGVHKDRSFRDTAAAALALKERFQGRKLCVMGASNGGLHVCGAIARWPSFFDAGIAEVPVTDLLCIAESDWLVEYGDPRKSDELEAMLVYSPLQQLSPSLTPYPPLLMTTSINDDRVSAYHTHAYASRLVEIGAETEPWVLCDGELGHWGGETDVQRAEKYARFRAFIDIVLTCNENGDQRP
jgi:prolyl oligopeptidase